MKNGAGAALIGRGKEGVVRGGEGLVGSRMGCKCGMTYFR